MDYKILIGTHHKTGTVWIAKIFRKIARKFNLIFTENNVNNIPEEWDIFFQDHSKFDWEYFKNFNYRGIHIIRDPRDVIISGAFYHCNSDEKWLHVKKPKFGNLTYQEKILSYEKFDDRLLFEMEHSAFWNNKDIHNWDYNNSKFFNVKYEDLIIDDRLFLFHQIFDFLGFKGDRIPQCLQTAYNSSLFSGKVEDKKHIRSGKSKQWQQYFKPQHKQKFIELHGDILIDLDYEKDNQWTTNN